MQSLPTGLRHLRGPLGPSVLCCQIATFPEQMPPQRASPGEPVTHQTHRLQLGALRLERGVGNGVTV